MRGNRYQRRFLQCQQENLLLKKLKVMKDQITAGSLVVQKEVYHRKLFTILNHPPVNSLAIISACFSTVSVASFCISGG